MRVVLLLVLLSVPTIALAAPSGFFGPIVPPCAYSGGSEPCQACDLVAAGDNLLRVLVALSVFAATLMLAYAGFLYVTAAGNSANIDSAKTIFGRVLIGMIMILGAFLIVDVVLRTFTNQNFNALTRIECVMIVHGTGAEPITGYVNVPPPSRDATGTPLPRKEGTLSHDDAMKQIKEACEKENICVTVTSTAGTGGVSGTCSGAGCTNLTGIRQETVDQAIEFARKCGCQVTITGATEGGVHDDTLEYSHVGGYKMDIDDNAGPSLYIRRNFTSVQGSTNRYVDACGNVYLNHDGHWDITVRRPCKY